ncbi:ABC transporter ATP-binding protein [Nonomuraea jiangxiensis]|uniref:ABC-2 type transport system ATP-binding protein n=1 Tax=Nonomuraea jiangxiensis TaxID=633440 RepID=A0A1G7ZXZ8_9ACTN|nr:ABC transporter ATP-binding protein [Nonomuraea jiangxiensis]SDH13568.1 ABC-2 type transport system ATP-binding protein [Nonomuraea jiangxiensis]
MSVPAVLVTEAGRRYGRRWALRHCSLAVPAGRVVGLIGPNGAGKTTLLRLLAGLLGPSEGEVRVFGRSPTDPAGLPTVAFLPQDKPLYNRFTVTELIRYARELNPRFDAAFARSRLDGLGIEPGIRAGQLSGGQRAQVALTLALAKGADLVILDEPVANLDPLGRHDVMRDLMTVTEERGLTVVLSSHVLSDLEDACDYLVLLQGGRVQLAGEVDDVRASHVALNGPADLAGALDEGPHTVVARGGRGRQATALVRLAGPHLDPRWIAREPGLEEIVLAYLRNPEVSALPKVVAA